MTFKRASKGNVRGIETVQKELDPTKQKLVLLRESQMKDLKQKAFDTGKSESELVREALDKYL